MKKFFLSLALILVIIPLDARRVKGVVSGPEGPLAGVIVSDGYGFTKTSDKGKFSLKTNKDARFVFVVTPSGYVGDFSDGAPRFFQALDGSKKFEFQLQKYGGGDDYTIFSVSDPQMSNKKHLKRFKAEPMDDLRAMSKEYSAKRPTVGIALGDIAWNKLEYFDYYKKQIATTGIPFYSVIGNHDYIQNLDGIAAAKGYEDAFGPYNYAFFLGKDLVIGLNNIQFVGSGKEDPKKSSNNYVEGYSPETLNFLRGLLKYVGKDAHLYIAQHSPISPYGRDNERKAEFLSILEGYQVDILSGHTHIMAKNRVSENVMDNNAAAIGGAWWATDLCRDGTPRGYDIVSCVAGERSILWHNIDYSDDYQVSFIEKGRSAKYPDSVEACAWAADKDWTCTWTEDGRDMGNLELKSDKNAAYTDEILAVYDGDIKKVPGFKKPVKVPHYYIATPSATATKVTMTVTAPDGRSWTHEFELK